MKNSGVFLLLLFFCAIPSSPLIAVTRSNKPTIGLVMVATGKYIDFARAFIESADKHFFNGYEVTYFVLTDTKNTALRSNRPIVTIFQKRLGWPHDTMMRFEMYCKHAASFRGMDYLFASDSDMRFVADVGSEMLSARVATQSPGFVNKQGPFERRKESTAYVARPRETQYFAGGFYGGTAQSFLHIIKTCADNINKDLAHNLIAAWHDESHLNHYFSVHKPTLILNPSYCYPESWALPYPKKLLALDKNHKEFQTPLN
jgi:histo-blood group ABO system transferase